MICQELCMLVEVVLNLRGLSLGHQVGMQPRTGPLSI